MAEFNNEVQQLFLDMLMSDPDMFVRCRNIIETKSFDKNLRKAVEFITNYVDEHRSLPDFKQVKAMTGTEIELVEMNKDKTTWFMNEFEKFCRYKAIDRAILDAADLLEQGDYGTVERIIKEAVQVGLARNMGTKYFKNPKERLLRIKENNSMTSTGWPLLDKKLYGGFERGTLNIFAGGSGCVTKETKIRVIKLLNIPE